MNNCQRSLNIDLGYDIYTVRDMSWLGKKNGDLLESMTVNNFNVLLTNDKNLYYQQKIDTLKICIVNINSKTNRYADILELMDLIKTKLKEIETWLSNSPGGYFIV